MKLMLMSFAALLVTLVALAEPAAAKEQGVEVSSTPTGIDPGEPWTPTIRVLADPGALNSGRPPTIVIRNTGSGESVEFTTAPTGKSGIYDARVVFPEAGTWSYEIVGGIDGRIYPYPAVTIGDPVSPDPAPQPAPSEPVSDPDPGSLPAAPLAGGLAGVVVLGLALVGLVRIRRAAS